MKAYKLKSTLFLFLALLVLSCSKDETLNYPVVATYQSTTVGGDFSVWVKENDTLREISRELTTLDEDPRFAELKNRPNFSFFEFQDETAGRYLFDLSFNVLGDTTAFSYRQENNQVVFTNLTPSTREVVANGTVRDFEILSQATLFTGSVDFFMPNYFIIDPPAYNALLENGDTLVEVRYTEFYRE